MKSGTTQPFHNLGRHLCTIQMIIRNVLRACKRAHTLRLLFVACLDFCKPCNNILFREMSTRFPFHFNYIPFQCDCIAGCRMAFHKNWLDFYQFRCLCHRRLIHLTIAENNAQIFLSSTKVTVRFSCHRLASHKKMAWHKKDKLGIM